MMKKGGLSLKRGTADYSTKLPCNNIVLWPGGASGKALCYGLDGPGSIPGVGGVEIFLHSFVSRLVLGSTQPPIK